MANQQENNIYEEQYNRAKLWELGLFSFNNTATNIYLFGFGFISYYSTGLLGLTALVISQILGYIRIFDGVIDPGLGAFIDKFYSRFGKYRPLMAIGNIITAISFIILFQTHLVSEGWRFPILVIALLIHKVGYSLQASVTKAGQAALTNDPKQRPVFSMFDGIFTTLIFTGGQFVVSNFIYPQFQEYNSAFFANFIPYIMGISAVLTVLAIIGISSKDNIENFGIGENTVSTKLKDYWPIIKGNRPLQTLAMAGAFVKLNTQLFSDQVTQMMIFGILFGSFAISGQVSLIMVVPNVLIAMAASAVARNKGLKWSYVTWLSIGTLCLITLGLLMWNGQPGMIDFSNLTLYAVMFIVFYICGRSFSAAPSGLILTMAADVSDYETSESGRYVSGMMGTIFSLTDSIASSLAPMSIGWVLAAVGHGGAYPDESTALTPNLRIAALVIMVGIPVVANLLALGFMKFYTLDKETMEGIQGKLSDMRRARNKEAAERIAETEQVVAE